MKSADFEKDKVVHVSNVSSLRYKLQTPLTLNPNQLHHQLQFASRV
jgi:hypothetical protein